MHSSIERGYIKGDRTKHISPKFFFTHDLIKSGDIDIQQIRSCDNLTDLFTKTLPTRTFEKLVHGIGMRRLKDIKWCCHQGETSLCTLFSFTRFLSQWVFPSKVFNEAQKNLWTSKGECYKIMKSVDVLILHRIPLCEMKGVDVYWLIGFHIVALYPWNSQLKGFKYVSPITP